MVSIRDVVRGLSLRAPSMHRIACLKRVRHAHGVVVYVHCCSQLENTISWGLKFWDHELVRVYNLVCLLHWRVSVCSLVDGFIMFC